nr:immunoglobulin heavy chain junction region [Mus musculus]
CVRSVYYPPYFDYW